ncbi:MAG: DUF4329 domain-containing protein [Cellvibrionaceae bacterium]
MFNSLTFLNYHKCSQTELPLPIGDTTMGSSTPSKRPKLTINAMVALMLIVGAATHANPDQTFQVFDSIESQQCQANQRDLNVSSAIENNIVSEIDNRAAAQAFLDQELTVEEESYPDALTAVIAASNYFNPLSIQEDREYIGAILKHKRQGHFIYTVSSGQSGEDTVSARIQVPAEYEITAFWHTHGNHHWTRKYFSDIDTQLAKQWGLPFYMAEASGKLRVYHPEDPTLSSMRSRKLGLGYNSGYAKGRIVSQQQERVQLATHMSQWLAMHQTPAARSPSSSQPLSASISNHCDPVVTRSWPTIDHRHPNQS